MTAINTTSTGLTDALKQLRGVSETQSTSPVGNGSPSFGDLLKAGVSNAIDAQHKSEDTAAKALLGKADMTEVLQAVNDAEVALNTVLAIRDKVVQAYTEVMRTPI